MCVVTLHIYEYNNIWSVTAVSGYRLDDQNSIPGRGRDFPLHHHVQSSSADQSILYPMGTRAKVAAA